MDEVNAPAGLLLDFVEDVKGFFLLAADGEEIACDG